MLGARMIARGWWCPVVRNNPVIFRTEMGESQGEVAVVAVADAAGRISACLGIAHGACWTSGGSLRRRLSNPISSTG